MTTVGRWSPNKVRARVLDGTWVSAEELGGMVLVTPSSIAYSGTSASIGANGSVEFSAVTSLSLNGVFTADYDNYMMVMQFSGTAATGVLYRLRSGGTDNSTASSYVFQYIEANGSTVSAARSTQNYGRLGVMGSTLRNGISANIYGPYLSQPTAVRAVCGNSISNARLDDAASTHNQSTSYDGCTIYPESGNFTGLVSVYGLVGA